MAVAFLFLVFFVLMPLVHPQPCLCVTQRSRSVRFGHADCVTCRCAISLPHCLCVALRSHSVRFALSNCATYRCVVPVSHCCSPDVKPGGINFPGLRDPLAPRPIATGSDDEDVRQRERESSHQPASLPLVHQHAFSCLPNRLHSHCRLQLCTALVCFRLPLPGLRVQLPLLLLDFVCLLPCLQGGVLASVLGTGQGGGGKGGSRGAGGKAKGVPKKRDRPAEDKAGHAVGTCLTWLCCHGVPHRPSSFRSGCSWLRAHAAGEGAADVDGLQFSPLLPFPFD
jgi:hypothetical protein